MFFFILSLIIFFFFDEEPFFDFTDWNILHILFIVICVLSIINENIVKSKYGQYVIKDKILLFSTFSYWFFLQNYVFLVIIVFCFHCLTPLEIELFEMVEVYNNLLNYSSIFFLFNILLFLLLLVLTIIINFIINWDNKFNLVFFFNIICIVVILLLILSIWDFLFNSLTATIFWNNFKSFYLNSKVSLTYDNVLFLTDQFDWHKDQTNNFIIRFEDLYMFSIAVFSILSFICYLVTWFILIKNYLLNFYFNKDLSYLFYSSCFCWLNNCIFVFNLNFIIIFFVSLRIYFKILFEISGFVF